MIYSEHRVQDYNGIIILKGLITFDVVGFGFLSFGVFGNWQYTLGHFVDKMVFDFTYFINYRYALLYIAVQVVFYTPLK